MPERKGERDQYEHWCEYECSQCEIGAHERCSHKECHMPKWDDLEKKSDRRKSLLLDLLGPLTEMEFEFVGRVDALLHQQRVHRVNRRLESFIAGQHVHRFLEADQGFAKIGRAHV